MLATRDFFAVPSEVAQDTHIDAASIFMFVCPRLVGRSCVLLGRYKWPATSCCLPPNSSACR